MLPDWYLNPEVEPLGDSSRRSSRYLRRALARFAEALALDLSTSASRAKGVLSGLDARAKIVGILALIIGVTLVRGLIPLGVVLLAAVILALAGGVGIRRLARLWTGVPIFTAAIALPAITNFVTPGNPVLTILHLPPGASIGPWPLPNALTITDWGLTVAARLLLRATDCVTLAFILVATTDHAALMNGLRRLGMPKVFGMTLSMTQRYIGLLVRAAEELHLAKMSRTISAGPARREQRWVASGIAALFRRTHRLAREVHDAMISRGYDGDLQVRKPPSFRIADGVWLAASVLVAAAIVITDKFLSGA
jgi:cobalt/nickel transport system permease protein